jgi:hypothetical protein
MDKTTDFRCGFSINSKMAVIGGNLPKDFPTYSTVFWHYKQWRSQGIIQKITEELHRRLRQQEKKLVDDSNYD